MFDVIISYFTVGWQIPILLCVLFVAIASGVLSPIVVGNRMAFFSDAVAHSTLAGVALGMLLGIGSPLTTMVGFAIIVALLIATLRQFTSLYLDTLLGVAMAGSLALGVLLYHHVRGYADLHGYLFGQVSLLTWTDVWVLGTNAVLALAIALFFSNRFLMLSVSRPLAQARGVNAAAYEYLLIVLLGLVVSLGVRAVGLLLVNALLIVPAAASRNIARSVAGMYRGSIFVALFSGLVGLFGADYLAQVTDSRGLPPAPAIVVVAVACFIATQIIRVFTGRARSEAAL